MAPSSFTVIPAEAGIQIWFNRVNSRANFHQRDVAVLDSRILL
jgi:hypothetical protein